MLGLSFSFSVWSVAFFGERHEIRGVRHPGCVEGSFDGRERKQRREEEAATLSRGSFGYRAASDVFCAEANPRVRGRLGIWRTLSPPPIVAMVGEIS